MANLATIRDVFGYFQNLNLLALLQDLGHEQTARRSWFSGSRLCPVAHGLPAGQQVRELTALGQAADLDEGCAFAARHLGADPEAVVRFVRAWDEEGLSAERLLRHLETLWRERLEDALAMQAVLEEGKASRLLIFPENHLAETRLAHVPSGRALNGL